MRAAIAEWIEDGGTPVPGAAVEAPRPLSRVPGRAPAREVVPSSAWFGPTLGGSQELELLAFLGAHNGVAVLQWPRDAGHVALLARVGLPRLLLVHPSLDPPPPDGPLQESLPLSAADDDVHRCLVALCHRAGVRRAAGGGPLVDGEGWVRVGDGRVQLPPVEHRLADVLVAHFGLPVDDAELLSAEERCQPMVPAALEGHLARMCRRVNALGLEVAATPGGGHVLRWCRS